MKHFNVQESNNQPSLHSFNSFLNTTETSPSPLISFNKHLKNAKCHHSHTPNPPLRKEVPLRRSQNRPSPHRHDINHISHRAHIIRHHNIERSVPKLPRLLSVSHHIAFSRVFADFALRSDHVIHVVGSVQDQAAHVHSVMQRLDLTNADRRRAARPRIRV